MANAESQRDLVLAPGTYAFIQDRTQGALKICTGPTTVTPSQSDVPVKFDPKSNRFVQCSLEEAVCMNAFAEEGSYIVLRNPARNGEQPKAGMKGSQSEYMLSIGSKVVIPGPASFPLWPQQSAEAIEGHHLKSNQFLLVRVYNEELARRNWTRGVMRPAAPASPASPATDPESSKPEIAEPESTGASKVPANLTTGKLHIVKGTEVSFYLPPTGVEVVRDESGGYVRDALTLERMEYCILVDENGRKRYEKGPQVVFPEPTERFQVKDGQKKQSAIELNDLQGLHLKAIADCPMNDIKLKAGEEYFVTGAGIYDKDDQRLGAGTTIYYPREEISFVKYDGRTKIFATTVPEGEGRYVLNRITGEITTVLGPAQLLPNPCKFVIVRRVLTEKQCRLLFPGNTEALFYNQIIAAAAGNVSTTRGAVSEGDVERYATKSRSEVKGAMRPAAALLGSAGGYSAITTNFAGESSRVSGDQKTLGDEFERSSTYTSPRTLTLDTKYKGAVGVSVWTGYAVQVVSKTGARKVVIGPKNILLDYDEELERLQFSTGKPKTTENLVEDVYLRVENNKIADKIYVETEDHVPVEIYLSYKVNFRGPPEKWFAVENYVKYLCDHVRSLVKGRVRRVPIAEFYGDPTSILRDIILGPKQEGAPRAGMKFPENGMEMDDFEILGVTITDTGVQKMLTDAQREAVALNVELSRMSRQLHVQLERWGIESKQAEAATELSKHKAELAQQANEAQTEQALAEIANHVRCSAEQLKRAEAEESITGARHAADLARVRDRAKTEIEIEHQRQTEQLMLLTAETQATVQRFEAAKGGLVEALVALSDKEVLMKLGQSLNVQQILGGASIADTVKHIFQGSPVEKLMTRVLGEKPE